MIRKILGLGFIAGLVLVAAIAKLVPGSPLVYRAEAVISLPPERSWEKLEDLSLAHHYVPGVLDTVITSESSRGLGASRRVYSSEQDYINETVTHWEPGVGFTLALHDDEDRAPEPFARADFTYRLEDAGADATSLGAELHVVMLGGVIGEWLGKGVLSGTLQSRVDEVASSLKHYYESGP